MYDQADQPLKELEQRVTTLTPNPKFPHDPYIIDTLKEAIEAAKEGNFGVGAVLVNESGKIVQRGHNHVFNPHFRSDLHAEMDVMTKFEDHNKDVDRLSGYTLYTSLEPCPMCLTRLITSGVEKVYHAAPDQQSGMKLVNLTPVWFDLAEKQEFAQAQCSPELSNLALQIFLITANDRTQKLYERRTLSRQPN
jgi:tRNA(Arg) A34 adenosine deaminase TadA